MVAGNYDMVFSETWGPPYDPHSYVSSWTTPDEAHYSALPTAGIDTTQFAADVDAVLAEMDETERQKKWTAILASVHDEVLHLPLWYKRIPPWSTTRASPATRQARSSLITLSTRRASSAAAPRP